MKILNLLKKIPKEIWYIFLLFLSTRIVLTIIGVVSRLVIAPLHKKDAVWIYSKHIWLDIWGVHDTGWYLNVAANGYPPGFDPAVQSNWAYFPLYPLLMRFLGDIIGSYYVAGIIISNICLIAAAIFLYKLVRLDTDKQTAFGAVKYLFLFPTAFILSGVFTESLFLLLAIMGFYYAKKGNWWAAGIAGFFLSLTRSLGIIIVVPLLYEYLKTKNFKIERIRKDILWLALIPLGLVVFSIYNFYKTGNYLAFVYVQKAWGHALSNPLKIIVNGLISNDVSVVFASSFVVIFLIILIMFYKRIECSYTIFSLFLLVIPLLVSPTYGGLPRYVLSIFPLCIIFSKLGNNKVVDTTLLICLGLIQGFLMVFWANGFKLII